MILIFGGTTEGRLAVEVCEQAGTPFYYSTKGERQDVEMHNGVRLTGAMSADEISTFCKEQNIKCIIDAAHPFAENLHREITKTITKTKTKVSVIRVERLYEEHREGVIYCKGYDDTLRTLEKHSPKCLLALSGANTISKLKPYWQKHRTIFRILQRPESIEIALKTELPTSNLIFYNAEIQIPSVESEKGLFKELGCDAIITKESGETGGFKEKVEAALQLGLKVFVIEHPEMPSQWIKVTGKHTLRRAIEHVVPEFFPLKTGLTTGACATAAAKAAAISLLTGECPEEVSFALPDGEVLTIPVVCSESGVATVTKDWSDDPDVLRGCKITAEVRITNNGETCAEHGRSINFLQGEGVGRVTLPGLGIPIGGPAVNSTPRKMIMEELQQLATEVGFDVTISVENGRELAKKTFNHKVGVVDGISIIGTSGIVSPLSNEAFIHSIRRELEVARAIGCKEIGLVAGMKSERALQQKFGESLTSGSDPDVSENLEKSNLRCVHYGNFIGESLKAAYELGFESVILAIMIGKAVKLAEGHLNTHSHKVAMNKEFLKSMAPEEYAAQIDSMTMARELWDFMPQEFFNQIEDLCYRHCRTVFPRGELNIRLFKM